MSNSNERSILLYKGVNYSSKIVIEYVLAKKIEMECWFADGFFHKQIKKIGNNLQHFPAKLET